MMRLCLTLLIVTLATACAPASIRWVRASASTEQHQADVAACHKNAQTEAALEDATDRRLSPDSGAAVSQDSYRANMAAYEYRKKRDTLFGRCMADKGYSKGP